MYSPGVSVSSTSRSALDEVGDERGDAVVVAEADLVVGDGVVLVDDRHAAELEQPGQRSAGVEVLAPAHEVVRDEEHLRGDDAVTDRARRGRAPSAGVCPAAASACNVAMSAGRAVRPSAATPADTAPDDDDEDLVTVGPQGGDLLAQPRDRAMVDHTPLVRER